MSTANDRALQLVGIKVLKDVLTADETAIRAAAAREMIPGDRAGARLPDGTIVGAVEYRQGNAAKLKIVDEAAFLLWVKKNHPSEIVTTEAVRPAFRDVAIANVATTGEIPDGVEMSKPGNPTIAVPALPKGAAEAIIADFRINGIGKVLTLPAIEDRKDNT